MLISSGLRAALKGVTKDFSKIRRVWNLATLIGVGILTTVR